MVTKNLSHYKLLVTMATSITNPKFHWKTLAGKSHKKAKPLHEHKFCIMCKAVLTEYWFVAFKFVENKIQ